MEEEEKERKPETNMKRKEGGIGKKKVKVGGKKRSDSCCITS